MSRHLAAIVLLALLVSGCGSASQRATPGEGASTAESSKRLVASAVTVPDVVGLSEGEAVKALTAAGLVANVRYADDVPRAGAVYRAVPVAGREVQDHSVVLLRVSLPRRLPPPGQEHELETGPLSRLVTDHPDVFVGLYRDEAAVPHVV